MAMAVGELVIVAEEVKNSLFGFWIAIYYVLGDERCCDVDSALGHNHPCHG